MVRKSLKGVRSPVSIKEENKMQVNEMAIATNKKIRQETVVSLAVQGNTMGGYNLQCTVIRGRILIDEIKESTS